MTAVPVVDHREDSEQDRADQPALWLPETFWDAREHLASIRQAAHSRLLSADTVFHCVLTRVSAVTSHTVRLPAIVGATAPLSYYAATVGPSGDGKSSAYRAAAELVPGDDYVADHLPIGSGEGLIESLFEFVTEPDPDTGKPTKVKKQTRHQAAVFIDEGEALTAIAGRSGSTTLATLRSAWTGGPLGQANASTERRRVVPAGSYTFGVAVAIQPTLAGPLLDDTAAGTPQRFAWCSSSDPSVPDEPPPWPDWWWQPPTLDRRSDHTIDVAPEVADVIRAHHLARRRGEIDPGDVYNGHRNLLRLKVAANLSLLCHQALTVTGDMWDLAGVVVDTSDNVRRHAQAAVTAEAARRERETSARHAKRQVEAVARTEEWRTKECAKKIAARVRRRPGITVRLLQQAMTRNQRDVFGDGLALAITEGWVVETNEPSRTGSDKRILNPAEAAQ